MSISGYENFRDQIRLLPAEITRLVRTALQLPVDEQQRLLAELDHSLPSGLPFPDYARELTWLREHRHLYRGQHVAVLGDQLIAHDSDLAELYRKVDAAGVLRPLTAWVEPEDYSSAGGGLF